MLKFSERFRPKDLDEFIGQTSIIGKNSFLRRAIESKNIPHIFLYGPPGVGKTTLSYIIAEELKYDFFSLNATSLGIKEIRDIIEPYKHYKKKPLIFIDEIHRLNKKQQEVLLPIMEFNKAIIIGASTENLYSSLTDAIRSRGVLLKFNYLTKNDLRTLLTRVTAELQIEIDKESTEFLLTSNSGDARALLIHLELAYNVNSQKINLELLKSIKKTDNIQTNRDSTSNLMSAFIKSIRGSDPDAAVYYLIMLIEKGEKADYIARRLVILASEDIGNANPNALTIAVSTMTATKQIGYPESKLILTQCVTYLASSPKSNSVVTTIDNTYNAINSEILSVPEHLKLFSKNYKNPHDYNHYLKQNYLSKSLKLVKLKGIAFESRLLEWLEKIRSN